MKNLSSLNNYSVKQIGILSTVIFIIIKILSLYVNRFSTDMNSINNFILLSLMLIVFSKEKIDDERSQTIRYFALKVTCKFFLLGTMLSQLIKFNLNLTYVAISTMLIYLLIFNLASYFNPRWIFSEKTEQTNTKLIIGIMALFTFIFLYDILS